MTIPTTLDVDVDVHNTPEERKVLALDLDDVTANLTKKVIEYYNATHPELSDISVQDMDDWHENSRRYHDFYVQDGIYLELEVIENARTVILELMQDYDVVFVTAAPTKQATLEKYDWVDKHFPEIGYSNVISTTFKHLIRADILVDDSPVFLPPFKGKRILMTMPYNLHLVQGKDYEYRVSNWLDIEQLMKEGKI